MQMVRFSRDSFLWALSSLCQLHRRPFSAELLLRDIAPEYDLEKLVAALPRLGLKVRTLSVPVRGFDEVAAPLLVLLHPGSPDADPQPATEGGMDGDPVLSCTAVPALLLRADRDRVLLLRMGANQPETLNRADVEGAYAGTALLATPDSTAGHPDPDSQGVTRRFGLRTFAAEMLRHRIVWRDVLLASLALQLVALATPLLTQVIIDKVIVHHSTSTLQVVAAALVLFAVFSAALNWLRQYLILHTGNRVDAVLGRSLFEKLVRLPVAYFEKRATGLITTRIQAIETVRQFLGGAAVSLVIDTPFLLLFVAVMFYYSWQLTLIVLCILTVIVAASLLVTPILRDRMNKQFQVGAQNQAFLTEYVSGMSTVKTLQMEAQVTEKFSRNLADYLEASFNARQLSNTYNVFSGTLEQLMTLSVLCAGAWMAMTREGFSVGMLVAFQMIAGRVSGPVMRMVGMWLEYQQVSIAARRLGDIMDAPAEPYSLTPSRARNSDSTVTMCDVSFRYGDDRPYLYRGFNLTLAPGKCVALMGPSGAGKSTLAKLLLGFVQPTDGQVKLGELDIRHLGANELRGNFGVVPQETVLFSGTIYDNLLAADPHASFDQVIEACKMADINAYIESLPQGYQTRVGEHGSGLSGGQKQRLAIARALLKRPRILIFDEATSGLDAPAAEEIARTINRLKGRVSVLFIAHHLPRGLRVDEVVTLGDMGHGQHLSVFGRREEPVPMAPATT
ncbi:peptidase domain-containing ABC transporter [Aromatoleum evansii]|uniref:peptidase domain-containing ABC transporter n=1 Tax=Aromatoleum evansii TaxID=59406 RepID=UPI001B7CE743|nr:peptidase domain-containing ABC transporter [Aromatoleum evansii]